MSSLASTVCWELGIPPLLLKCLFSEVLRSVRSRGKHPKPEVLSQRISPCGFLEPPRLSGVPVPVSPPRPHPTPRHPCRLQLSGPVQVPQDARPHREECALPVQGTFSCPAELFLTQQPFYCCLENQMHHEPSSREEKCTFVLGAQMQSCEGVSSAETNLQNQGNPNRTCRGLLNI